MRVSFEVDNNRVKLYLIHEKTHFLGEFDVDEALSQIDELIKSLENTKKKIKEQTKFEPQKVWELLKEAKDVEDMIPIFNNLEESHRRQLAEFILSQVNIFKGAGAIFVEHYDPNSAKLFS